MDASRVIQMLRDVEHELIGLIAETDDFEERAYCLQLAQQARELADSCVFPISKQNAAQMSPSVRDERTRQRDAEDTSGLPAYFVNEEKLYKIGQGRNAKLYRKSVDLREALEISDVMIGMLDSSEIVRISDLFARVAPISETKVQVLVMAAVAAGILESAGRGKYRGVNSRVPRKAAWKSKLLGLPVRDDLLDQFGRS